MNNPTTMPMMQIEPCEPASATSENTDEPP